MAKILGLDLGTNSIGWAVVDYDRDYITPNGYREVKEQFMLSDKGVYIFTEGVDKDSYGNPQSRAALRTDKRSARRLKFRRKLRKYETLKALIKHKMCPLDIKELEKWRQNKNPVTNKTESFKHYPTNPAFLEWLQTDNQRDKENKKDKLLRKAKTKNPYYFRDKASREKVTPLELGRAIYHLAQRRGFLSGRLDKIDVEFLEKIKPELYDYIADVSDFTELYLEVNNFFDERITEGNTEENKTLNGLQKKIEKEFKVLKNDFTECKKYVDDLLTKQTKLGPVKQEITDLTEEIEKENCKTIGQLFYKYHLINKEIRRKYLGREEHYEVEFNVICKTQGITEKSETYKELYNGIFYQRKLKSQKGLVGKCTLEPKYARCPVSHPAFEEFRALKFINNIKRKVGEEWRPLDDGEKKKIWHKFFRKKDQFDFREIAKLINPNYPKPEKGEDDPDPKKEFFNYKGNTTVTGCYTVACLMSIFGKDWEDKEKFNERTWQDILENPVWKSKLFERCRKKETKNRKTKKIDGEKNIETVVNDVWHTLFTYDKESKLVEFASKYFAATPKEAESFSKVQLKQEYASFSIKAIRNINQFLREGQIETYAVFLAKIPELIPEVWNNKADQKLIRDAIGNRIENYRETKRMQTIVNDLYKKFRDDFGRKDFDTPYILDEKDKSNVNEKIISVYGAKTVTAKSNEEQKAITEFVLTKFENCIRKNQFINIKRIDKVIEDFFLEHPALGIDEELAKKLYHPSDIEKFKEPISITDKDGKTREYLNSPISGSIKNPTVFRALFQLRKVLHELILTDKIDRETRVHIEVAGNLNDMNYRKAIEDWQADREKENQQYKQIIIGLFKAEKNIDINEPDDDDIKKIKGWYDQYLLESDNSLFELLPKDEKDPVKKYRLWQEQKGICVYTGKQIPLNKLFDGISFDIEHTIPKSKSNDNSLENLTVCDAAFNRKNKIGRIPYDLGEEKRKEILSRIDKWQTKCKTLEKQIKKLAKAAAASKDNKDLHDKQIREKHKLTFDRNYWYAKYSRFTMEEIPEGFTNRNLNDTRIISRYAQQWLKSYFDIVHSINGNITYDFRKIWGLQKDYEKKERINHIHHCIDAITIACITKDKYDQLAHAYKTEEEGAKEIANKLKSESKPWKTFVQDLNKIENEVAVAHQFLDNLPKQTKKYERARGRKQYVMEYEKDANGESLLNEKGKRIIKKDADEKVIYKLKYGNRIPKIQQGDTVRGALHQETYYGAIKVAKRDADNKIIKNEKGEILFKKDKDGGELSFVVRKELEKLKQGDIESIVDIEIKKIIQNAEKDKLITFKKTGAVVKHPIWQNEEKQIPIKKVRIFSSIKNPLPDFKKHRDVSKLSHKHKEQIYVTNAENYCLAIYEGKNEKGKVVRDCEIVNTIDAGEYFRLSNKKHRGQYPITQEKKNGLPFKTIIRKGQMVLLYDKTSEEIWLLSDAEKLERMYKITQLDTEKSAEIKLLYHQEARDKKILTELMGLKTGMKGGKNIGKFREFPWIKLGANSFDALLEGLDFILTPTGEIKKK